MTLPVKPINEIEEKAEVGLNDKILILDADSEEARLASKDELKGDKGPKGNGITTVTATKSGKTTTVTMNYDSGNPTVFQVQDGADGQGSGDMSASTYDPTGKMADAFDYDNMYNTPDIPSTAADVGALPDSTKYGASLDLSINSTTYVITAQLKDQDGNNLGTAKTVDLPLESVVVGGSYNPTTKKVVLTLQNGSTIEFSVADLVAGLQSEITSTNKLDSDLVDDTNQTHKFVTQTDKDTWDGKQDTLVSGTNIKTVNSTSLLGSGDVAVQPTLVSGTNIKTVNSTSLLGSGNVAVQPTLVSGTNIKTINSTSLLGSGDIAVQPTLTAGVNIDLTSNKVSANNYFLVTEDIVTVTTDDTKGVAPYNTSYGYTNIDIDASSGITWKEGAVYTFDVNTEMVVASAYRNVRVKIGSGAYIPVMGTTAIIAGSSYFTKANTRQYQYSTKYQSGGALHLFTDSNTTYSNMSASEANTGTATSARTISASVLKGAVQTHAPVQSVNGQTGAVVITAGDVLVSDQANNILTSGMKIRAGTQANYEALSSYDNNTVYLTI